MKESTIYITQHYTAVSENDISLTKRILKSFERKQ